MTASRPRRGAESGHVRNSVLPMRAETCEAAYSMAMAAYGGTVWDQVKAVEVGSAGTAPVGQATRSALAPLLVSGSADAVFSSAM